MSGEGGRLPGTSGGTAVSGDCSGLEPLHLLGGGCGTGQHLEVVCCIGIYYETLGLAQEIWSGLCLLGEKIN